MVRTLRSAVLLFSAISVLITLSSARTGAQKTKAAAKAEQTQAAVQQLIPLQAPTPEQMPAQPPQVTFRNGLLAINADNSNLADVLRGVRSALGIALDTPPGAGSERVVVHLGPGQPRDVLTQFFSGSKYDYILVGTAQDPQGVSQVILTPRQSTTVAGNVGQPTPAQPPIGGVSTGDEADAADPDDTAQQQQPEPTAAPQVPATNPYQPNTPPQPGNSASSGGETGGQQVKTPEQLLQELQRMQQQQQQQQPNRPQ